MPRPKKSEESAPHQKSDRNLRLRPRNKPARYVESDENSKDESRNSDYAPGENEDSGNSDDKESSPDSPSHKAQVQSDAEEQKPEYVKVREENKRKLMEKLKQVGLKVSEESKPSQAKRAYKKPKREMNFSIGSSLEALPLRKSARLSGKDKSDNLSLPPDDDQPEMSKGGGKKKRSGGGGGGSGRLNMSKFIDASVKRARNTDGNVEGGKRSKNARK